MSVRRFLATGLWLAGALVGEAAVAVESSPPVLPTVAEQARNPVAKETSASRRKPAERKAGETRKTQRHSTRTHVPQLEEKNLGLGCAQP